MSNESPRSRLWAVIAMASALWGSVLAVVTLAYIFAGYEIPAWMDIDDSFFTILLSAPLAIVWGVVGFRGARGDRRLRCLTGLAVGLGGFQILALAVVLAALGALGGVLDNL